MKKVLSFIRPHSGLVLLSLLMAVVSVVLTLYVPVLTGRVIDEIVGPGAVQFERIARIMKVMVFIVLITAAAQWVMNVANNRIVCLVSSEVREQAFEKIEILPVSYLDAHSSGDLVSRVIADVDQFADGLLLGFTQFFTGVATILGTLVFMLVTNAGITLVVVLLTPVSLLAARFIAQKTYAMFRMQSEARGEQTALVDEMVANQKVVQAYGQEKNIQGRFDKMNERLRSYSLRAVFFSSITNPVTRFVNSLVYTGVGLTGALCVVRGVMSVGQLSAFLSYANQYTKPFNEISGVVTELQNALACAGRVFEFLEAPAQTPDAEAAKEAGQRVAIVGPTGCGKTTLINLLMRFYDVNSGAIKIEGTDIREVKRHDLRSTFGMVLQDTWLSGGTIRDNIAMGRPEAEEKEIIEAAKRAHAHSFIRRLPRGYDTVIGENGGSLSQGQKQLLCIARVMLCLPPMLILDEATSSIDIRTEDGNVIEQGNHESLLKKGGAYARLYNSQFVLSQADNRADVFVRGKQD